LDCLSLFPFLFATLPSFLFIYSSFLPIRLSNSRLMIDAPRFMKLCYDFYLFFCMISLSLRSFWLDWMGFSYASLSSWWILFVTFLCFLGWSPVFGCYVYFSHILVPPLLISSSPHIRPPNNDIQYPTLYMQHRHNQPVLVLAFWHSSGFSPFLFILYISGLLHTQLVPQ